MRRRLQPLAQQQQQQQPRQQTAPRAVAPSARRRQTMLPPTRLPTKPVQTSLQMGAAARRPRTTSQPLQWMPPQQTSSMARCLAMHWPLLSQRPSEPTTCPQPCHLWRSTFHGLVMQASWKHPLELTGVLAAGVMASRRSASESRSCLCRRGRRDAADLARLLLSLCFILLDERFASAVVLQSLHYNSGACKATFRL